MINLFRIARFTMRDQLRHKSFYLLLAVCVLFVLLIRGCYRTDMVVNGRAIDAAGLALHLTAFAFQVICYAMFLVTALLSMNTLSRDAADGATVMILSRPVARWQYLLGRLAGTWLLCALFMLILHALVYGITRAETGRVIEAVFTASLLTSVNLLFIVTLVFLLSLWMPDVIAALFCFAVVAVGFVSETGHRLLHSGLFQAFGQGAPPDPAPWQVLFPKINMVQQYAGSLVTGATFQGMGPVHPLVNLLCWLALTVAVLLAVFQRREVV